ncbi:MAG: NADH-quinone oxidoreductase subunit M [Dehalococcoidia bacterium]|nr:NADH-quinone oxidoreductase subunit M [Dehalococcoidia bacterium]
MVVLTLLIPFLASLMISLSPNSAKYQPKYIALFFSLITFLFSMSFPFIYDFADGAYGGYEKFVWLNELFPFEISIAFGVDGLACLLVILTNLLAISAVLISFNIKDKAYYTWLMILQGSIIGVFVSLNLIQFFIFWELELLPMFMLITFWGTGNREYSAMKFVLYTLVASALILTGIIILGYETQSFDIIQINSMGMLVDSELVSFAFWFLMIGFLIKLPIFPFHTWLPDAHTDAPTAVSVMLAGILLKMGGYGILKIILPTMGFLLNDYGLLLGSLGAFSIIYGAIQTLKQSDLKRVIAFSSISHMGFVLVGIASNSELGILGASLQLITHGLISGLLFLGVGLIYERTNTREISDMSGITNQFPKITLIMMFAGLASLGLPGMIGFIAEIIIFIGSYQSLPFVTVVAISGVLFSAAYMLWSLQRIFFGIEKNKYNSEDINSWPQLVSTLLLMFPIVAFGIYPQPFIAIMEEGLNFLLNAGAIL